MRFKKGFIIFLIVLIIGLYVINKINTARQLEFTLGIPRQVSLQTGNVTFILPLRVQNVTGTGLNLKSIDFDIKSAGQFLGKALLTVPVRIEPRAFTVIDVNVSISAFALLTAVKQIVDLFKQGVINLQIDGLVYAEGFQVPIQETFDFNYKNVI